MKPLPLRCLTFVVMLPTLATKSVRSQSATTPPASPSVASELPAASVTLDAAAQSRAKLAAATEQFVLKNWSEARRLLDEAEALQPNQADARNLRSQLSRCYYEAARAAYWSMDYVETLIQLDGADGTGADAQNQADAYNLRGLVFLKQYNFAQAEKLFQRAARADPDLWAAKFNYAATPFHYHNFTVARARFEALLGQMQQANKSAETELTHFEIFLTLLVEGKPEAARSFTQHFTFTEATPARYFCQAALSFYAGDVDKAQSSLEAARQRYPENKNQPYLEACRGLGWLPAATPAPITTAQETAALAPRTE